jgi:protoporphyrinogen oxidase
MAEPQTSVFDGPVVIVGAGVAGLVTAHLLAEAGAEVVVIEKLPIVGGLARSFHYDDFVFDCGPHRFYTANPNVSNYLDRVLSRHGTFFPRKSEVFFKGKYYGWPIKPQNLLQLPPGLAGKSFVDLAVNGFKEYGDLTFEDYILRQYGPTLYEHFFRGYSEKFLGINPRDTHSDWAKVGINRAIIDDKAQMQNLYQLLKTTLLSGNAEPPRFLYPKAGMQEAWVQVSELFGALGGRIITGTSARLEGDGDKITAVYAGEERIEPSTVIWTAPITLACDQLNLQRPKLDYLGLLLFNVMVNEEPMRDYQWCYYGSKKLLINRVSIPRFFSPDTAPQGTAGYCCEVTCMKDDNRWKNAERLTDWVIDDLVSVGMVRNRANVIDARVERLTDSYPIYRKDYPVQLDIARQQLAGFKNFHLAGRTGLFWYNNMDHSMENAMQLTKRLLRESGQAEAEEAAIAAGLPIGA